MKPTNLTKVQSHVMLVLHNMRMVPSNVRKIREPPNVTKVQSHVKLILHNVRIIQLNVKKKNGRTIKYDERTVTCDIGTAQY